MVFSQTGNVFYGTPDILLDPSTKFPKSTSSINFLNVWKTMEVITYIILVSYGKLNNFVPSRYLLGNVVKDVMSTRDEVDTPPQIQIPEDLEDDVRMFSFITTPPLPDSLLFGSL